MKQSQLRIPFTAPVLLLAYCAAAWGVIQLPKKASAGDHAYISQGEVTGDLALGYQMREEDRHYLQPVRFLLPEGCHIAAASLTGYLANEADPGLFAFRPGEVYRLKINRIPQRPDHELFPSVEILNRLYPPEGKALDYPVEIPITLEDMDLAISGKMVTRVIYLERSLDALPVSSEELESGLSIDVPLDQSPVEVAETHGKVMAILRIGSRLPDDTPNRENRFYFGLPPFELPVSPTTQHSEP